MPSLKIIRKRIASVKSTQKITRAMKMVAGARLARAQARILALRPYAVKTQEVLGHAWRERTAQGQTVQIYTLGRKGRDYLRRRNAPIVHDFAHIWDGLDISKARLVARTVVPLLVKGEIDSIYLVYNEFKSAMTQRVVVEPLLPLRAKAEAAVAAPSGQASASASANGAPDAKIEYIFEPDKGALLDRLVPMYVEISILRALLESMASELGARMTAMDSATTNAKEMISSLTLQYNRARQAAITKELMEIIGGAEALKE
jgi:F-type H+-transporting ATPase subunit gamma